MKKNIRLLLMCIAVVAIIVLILPQKKPAQKDTIIRAQLIAADQGQYVEPAGYYEGGAKLKDPTNNTEYGVLLCLEHPLPALTVGSYYDLNLSELDRAHNNHSAENSGCYHSNLTLSSKQ